MLNFSLCFSRPPRCLSVAKQDYLEEKKKRKEVLLFYQTSISQQRRRPKSRTFPDISKILGTDIMTKKENMSSKSYLTLSQTLHNYLVKYVLIAIHGFLFIYAVVVCTVLQHHVIAVCKK